MFAIISPIFWLFSVEKDKGALTSIYCATDDDIFNNSGAYYE